MNIGHENLIRSDIDARIDAVNAALLGRERFGAFDHLPDYASWTVAGMMAGLVKRFDELAENVTWSEGKHVIPAEARPAVGEKPFAVLGAGEFRGKAIEMWFAVDILGPRPHVFWGIGGDLTPGRYDYFLGQLERSMRGGHSAAVANEELDNSMYGIFRTAHLLADALTA
jgi:hypothetical protein